VASRRPQHKAPVLFGEPMRFALVNADGEVTWVRVYGDLGAQLTFRPGSEYPYHYEVGHAGGYAGTLRSAVAGIETLIRRTGRALPWAATVSRSFARSHGR
jgi:hypothetical protein